jgi:hypothetical protein
LHSDRHIGRSHAVNRHRANNHERRVYAASRKHHIPIEGH